MNFQVYLENTYRIIRDEPVILILGGIIVQVLTIVSLGILSGPVMGGYTLLAILYLRENKKPVFNDIFSGLQHLTSLIPYFLVLLFIFIGLALFIVPGLLFATWWLYVLPLMVDRKMPLMDAMRASMDRVNETGFIMHLVFLLLISFIPIILIDIVSTIIPLMFLLKILLPPFQIACLASLYIEMFPKSAAESHTEQDNAIIVPPRLSQSADEGNHPETVTEKSGARESTDQETRPADQGEPDPDADQPTGKPD